MSETTDETEVNVMKIAKFNGKKKSWDAWSVKFLARARKKGHKEILTGEKDDQMGPSSCLFFEF